MLNLHLMKMRFRHILTILITFLMSLEVFAQEKADGSIDTELDRYDIRLDLSAALYSCDGGDFENTHYYLKRMLQKAVRFDAAALEDIKLPVINTIMHIQELPHYANIWTGQPIMDWLEKLDLFTDEDLPGFKAIWEAVKEEVL